MSTDSSSSSHDGGDGENGGGEDFEGPSHSSQGFNSDVWPEPFLEDLATQIAIDAAVSSGRLAAAPALSNLFQVCRRWRSVSESPLLWQNLTQRIWHRYRLLRASWHAEYIYRHRIARNFRVRRYMYTTLPFPPNDNNTNDDISCSRLILSDYHIAAGFSDGSVRLYNLSTRMHRSTFRPLQRNHIGSSSHAVSGIFFANNRLVFASLDGDIHVASFNVPSVPRRAHLGDVLTDGVLIDFTGCNHWWVGLYAGVHNRALHVRNGNTEELVFVGGTLTDPYAAIGWELLTRVSGHVGRIRITSQHLVVAFTRSRVIFFDLRNLTIVEDEEYLERINVGASDVYGRFVLLITSNAVSNIRRVGSFAEICLFIISRNSFLGCMNSGYSMISVVGGIRVCEWEHGEYLYMIGEDIDEPTALAVNETNVVACTIDNTIHLWYFGE